MSHLNPHHVKEAEAFYQRMKEQGFSVRVREDSYDDRCYFELTPIKKWWIDNRGQGIYKSMLEQFEQMSFENASEAETWVLGLNHGLTIARA